MAKTLKTLYNQSFYNDCDRYNNQPLHPYQATKRERMIIPIRRQCLFEDWLLMFKHQLAFKHRHRHSNIGFRWSNKRWSSKGCKKNIGRCLKFAIQTLVVVVVVVVVVGYPHPGRCITIHLAKPWQQAISKHKES